MENKTGLDTEKRLLDARKIALQNAGQTSMRPHGKLWGMDVFTWKFPDPELLMNTISAFPFQVIWAAEGELLNDWMTQFPALKLHLKGVVAYDGVAGPKLDSYGFSAVRVNVEQTFSYLKTVAEQKTVLLFTCVQQEENETEIEKYLNLLRV